MTFPWEQLPAVVEPAATPAVEETVTLLQRDFAYAVQYTAVRVHSPHTELQFTVNTPRGQIVPRGECKLSDGSVLEFQDIGMPQPDAPTATVQELVAMVWDAVKTLKLFVK
jgi:hypothetical protein